MLLQDTSVVSGGQDGRLVIYDFLDDSVLEYGRPFGQPIHSLCVTELLAPNVGCVYCGLANGRVVRRKAGNLFGHNDSVVYKLHNTALPIAHLVLMKLGIVCVMCVCVCVCVCLYTHLIFFVLPDFL